VDASAVVELLRRGASYERVADVLLASGEILHAPHVVDAEVMGVLRRLERAATLDAGRAAQALDVLRELRLLRHDHRPLVDRAWSLRKNLMPFDALYVALAESLEAPLVTMDRRLGYSPLHGAEVIVL
jgi:predicted nucleic acid-binding protein